ncbi:MAG: patatin-like phospholipase family protein [Polyangiaceae bacterium]|nr:patatin-like phospholipase family protein [Polyangiaceae bacterium]
MNILSIDGGIAAALHLRLLRRIEEMRPGFLARVDLLAGTSDGALMALFLAERLGRDDAANLRAVGDCIDFFHEVLGVFRLTARTAVRFATGRGPSSLAAELERVFERHLGRETLGGLAARGRRVLAVAVDKATWRRRTFRSFDFEDPADRERTLVDLALACSAFPVVLPAHRSPVDGRAYLDGALITNNPSLVAVREALASMRARGGGEGDRLGEIVMLSLGGTERSEHRGEAPRGVLGWLPGALDRLGFSGWTQLLSRTVYLPDFMIQGSVDIIDLQCADLLGDRYRRVAPAIPEFDYLASIALPPERLRQRLDDEDRIRSRPTGADLDWVNERWLGADRAPADGGGAGWTR